MKKRHLIFSGMLGVMMVLLSIQFGNTTTLDTKGEGVPIDCSSTPYLESHTISADGRTSFKFRGHCAYSQGGSAWNRFYTISASWDGKEAREALSIEGENKHGTAISTCAMDPWLNKMSCQKKSISGNAFDDYQITGPTSYPLTGNVLTDAQRAQFMAELEQKKKEASCADPVLISPSPATGLRFNIPASVKVEIKHNPTLTPKEWQFSWAPTPKQGDWPTPSAKQDVSFSSLKTVNGVTTGIFNTSKVGDWQIQWKIDFPNYCNKAPYILMWTKFTVKEKSQGEKMVEENLKNKQYKPIDGAIPKPGGGTDPNWQQKTVNPQLQQKQLQQQQLQQQLQQKQNLNK